MSYDDNDEAYLEGIEQDRIAALDKGVALAERKAPEELIELKASITKEQFLETITERAIERLFGRYGNETLEHNIRKHVHAMVEREAKETIERVVREQIETSAAQICAEGFQETDNYGSPRGAKKTVAAFVLEHLRGKTDDYGQRDKLRLYAIADKMVGDYLEKEIKPDLEKLKKRCREAMDSSVTSKIKEAIVSGLGLRP